MSPPLRAPLVLATALFALALPRPTPRGEACPHPAALPDGTGAAPAHTRAVVCAPTPGGAPVQGPARLLFALPIDPNRADAATLERLPGIGPARTAAILDERARRPFARVDDLLRVHGIGPATLARIRPWLAIDAGAGRRTAAGPGAAALQRNR